MTKKAQENKEISVSSDKTITFQLTIKSAEAKKEYKKIIADAAKQIEIKGFRKGKAPLDVVEKELSMSKIYEDIIQNIMPKKYEDTITKNKITPIIRPQIVLSNPPLTLDKDWLFEIKTCQKPEMSLKAYQTELKKINKQKHSTPEEYNQTILNMLSSKVSVKIPQILLDTQTKERITQLIDSASQVGMTVKQYLEGKNTTVEDYQKNIKDNLIKEWKINLSLDKVANDQKIEVKEEDLKKAVPPQGTSQQQTNFIYYILRQQKTIDFLKTVK